MRKQSIDFSKRLQAQGCDCAVLLGSQISGYPEFVLEFEKHIFDLKRHATDCMYRAKGVNGSRTSSGEFV